MKTSLIAAAALATVASGVPITAPAFAQPTQSVGQPDYFSAYKGLRMTRDAQGVLLVELNTNGGPLLFSAQTTRTLLMVSIELLKIVTTRSSF